MTVLHETHLCNGQLYSDTDKPFMMKPILHSLYVNPGELLFWGHFNHKAQMKQPYSVVSIRPGDALGLSYPNASLSFPVLQSEGRTSDSAVDPG